MVESVCSLLIGRYSSSPEQTAGIEGDLHIVVSSNFTAKNGMFFLFASDKTV